MKIINRFIKDEKGQAIPLFALLAVVLFGFAALAMDWGMHYTTKSSYQKAADAAALAAAIDYPQRITNVSEITELSKTNMENVAVKIAQSNHTGIKAEDVKVSFDVLNRVRVEIALPFDSYFAGAAGFGKPEFTNSTDTDENDEVVAVAEKRTVWDGFALPFININGPTDGDTLLRNHDTSTNSWRDWLDGTNTGENFDDYQTPPGKLPLEQMRINPYDGLWVSVGNMQNYSNKIVQPILDLSGRVAFVYSINPDIIETIATKGIAILSDGGGNLIPSKTDSHYLIAPFAKVDTDGKYIPWQDEDPLESRIEQIVLLKVQNSVMTETGNGEFSGEIVGQFSITSEILTEIGKNKSRLVE